MPTTPARTATTTASPTNSTRTALRVNPRVFSTATSRVRSRIDIAMVFAATSRVANTTAPQIPRMKAFTLPSIATKSNPNAFSLSVLVCCGELWNMSSTAAATLGTSAGESARIPKVPLWSFMTGTVSSRYFRSK